MTVDDLAGTLRQVAQVLEDAQARSFGPEEDASWRQTTGEACVRLCGGDRDTARTLWKLIVDHCGGYMPACVAKALQFAASQNIVPDVEAPEPS